MMIDDTQTPDRALIRQVRGAAQGVLLCGDAGAYRTPLALTPSGEILLAAPGGALDSEEPVLHCPEERSDAAQLMVHCERLDPETDARADRFLALHMMPEGATLGVATLVEARQSSNVFDAAEIDLSNPLKDAERELLKALNADTERLASFVDDTLDADEVRAVSVDPDGVMLRTRIGPARIMFLPSTDTENAAQQAIEAMMTTPRGPGS